MDVAVMIAASGKIQKAEARHFQRPLLGSVRPIFEFVHAI
jgi:hypothetical protein